MTKICEAIYQNLRSNMTKNCKAICPKFAKQIIPCGPCQFALMLPLTYSVPTKALGRRVLLNDQNQALNIPGNLRYIRSPGAMIRNEIGVI